MKKLLITLAALSAAAAAPAQSTGAASVLFDCTTAKGRQILVTESGDTLTYRYGRKNRPELEFSQAKSEVAYSPWDGMGRHMAYRLDMTHQGTVYSVFRSADKHSDALRRGVYVVLPGDKASTVLCRSGRVRADELESLENKGFKSK